jgi:hypothetical protein
MVRAFRKPLLQMVILAAKDKIPSAALLRAVLVEKLAISIYFPLCPG